jgi:hypothetical protein
MEAILTELALEEERLDFHEAARDGDTVTVRRMLSTVGAQFLINDQYQDAHGVTPIFIAANNGHALVTEQLIEARCNVDLQIKDGRSPIFAAIERGHASITKQLIQARCNVDLELEDGQTPLNTAAAKGHAYVTEQLIEARCNVDHQSGNGMTALHMAAHLGHAAVAQLLLTARCNIDFPAMGLTALQVAELYGHAGIATLIRNRKQETPLLGRRVVINGLVAKPELNGRTGTAVSFEHDKGRYSVELDDTSSSLLIKPCNLLPVCVVWHCVASCFHCAYTTMALLMSLFSCRLACGVWLRVACCFSHVVCGSV